MKRFFLGVALALSLATPAAAKMLTLSFSGVLSSGADNTGVFGTDINLTNELVTLQFFIDTSLGTRTQAAGELHYIGGFFYPAGAPVTSGVVTVGGVKHLVANPIFGELIEGVPPGPLGDYISSQVSQLSENQTGPVLHFDTLSAFSGSESDSQLTPGGFDKPFSYTPARGDVGNATFEIFARDSTTDEITEDATGVFTPTLVTLEETGVPEAATWVMMLAGFGLVGYAMRSSHRTLQYARR